MKKILTAMSLSAALSGCLASQESIEAQEELIYQQYRHMSCDEMRTRYLAAQPASGVGGLLVGMALSRYGDVVAAQDEMARLVVAMRRKGCRLPEGVS